MSNTTPSDAISPARLRAEARKQKILQQGGDRLAKITGAMKAGSGASLDIYDAMPVALKSAETTTTAPPAEEDDPEEVDISKLSSSFSSATTGLAFGASSARNQATKRASNRSFEPHFPANDFSDLSAAGSGTNLALPMPPPGQEVSENPLETMMKMIGMPIPPGEVNDVFPPCMAGSPWASPFLQGMVGPDGQPLGAALPQLKTWLDRIFPLLHLLAVVGLAITTVIWWEPALRAFGNGQGGVEPMGWTEWVGKKDADWGWKEQRLIGEARLAVVPVFWGFVTVELALRAGQLFLSRFTVAPPPSIMQSLILSLPTPYSTLLLTLIKYYNLFSSLLDDLCVLIFVVGCVVIWEIWKSSGGDLEAFFGPE